MQEQKKLRSFLLSRGFLFIIIVVIIIIGFNFYDNYKKMQHLKSEIEVIHKNIEIIQKKNNRLEEEIENINEDDYIEEVAREKLGLVKQGEILLIPVNEN